MFEIDWLIKHTVTISLKKIPVRLLKKQKTTTTNKQTKIRSRLEPMNRKKLLG